MTFQPPRKSLKDKKKAINQTIQAYNQWLSRDKGEALTRRVVAVELHQLLQLMDLLKTTFSKDPEVVEYWNQAMRWLDQAKQEEDSQAYEPIEKRLVAYQSDIEKIKVEYEELNVQIQNTFFDRTVAKYPRKTTDVPE